MLIQSDTTVLPGIGGAQTLEHSGDISEAARVEEIRNHLRQSTSSKAPSAEGASQPAAPVQQLEYDNPRPRTKFRTAAILTALYLALFIAALDQTILATAIPTIAAQLNSASGYFWIGGAYLLANAAAGPIWAKCSDIWGRKPALLGAVILFAASSIIAALSTSMSMLIVGRAFQGTAGGGLVQLVIITISDLFSVRRRTLFIGLVEVMWAIAGGVGPLIGGAFTQLSSWRWCFWINLPVCGIALVLLLVFLDVHNPQTRFLTGLVAIDWFGTLSIVGVTLMLLLGLNFGGALRPWDSPTVICLLVFGTLMIAFFLVSEQRLARYPLMPLHIFHPRSNAAAFGICFLHGMVFIAVSYYLPLYFQASKAATPLRSGVLILPNVLPEAVTGIVVGLIMHRTGRYREITWAGLALLTLGTGLYISFTPATPISRIAGFQILGGVGSGALFEAPLIALHALVSQRDTAAATAAFGFVRNLATAMSIVLGGVVFSNGMDSQASALRAAGLPTSVIEALGGGKAAANVEIVSTITDAVQRRVVEEAFAWSLRNMWIMYTAIAGVGLLVSGFLVHSHLSEEHTETKTGLMEGAEGR